GSTFQRDEMRFQSPFQIRPAEKEEHPKTGVHQRSWQAALLRGVLVHWTGRAYRKPFAAKAVGLGTSLDRDGPAGTESPDSANPLWRSFRFCRRRSVVASSFRVHRVIGLRDQLA